MKNILQILFILLLISPWSFCQYDDQSFSLGVNAVYTTSAKIYLTPYSSDPILRNNAFSVDDIFNPSVEFKYRLSEPLILGLSVEYMTVIRTGPNLTVFEGSGTRTINVEDGFKFIPFELTLYYILPFSTESFKFTMGGGAGYYLGDHIRKLGDVTVSNAERKSAYGIHVSTGIDYKIITNTFLHFEMKFRDPQFTVKSRYSSRTVNYQGTVVRLSQDTFDSRVDIDGITFLLGVNYQF